LLDKNPQTRLGCGPEGAKEVKEHPFFKSIDWELLEKKECQPPFVPDVCPPSRRILIYFFLFARFFSKNKTKQNKKQKKGNKINFDATYELEEMLLEDNPLRSKPVKKHRKSTGNSDRDKQFQEIEEKFEAYSTLSSEDSSFRSIFWFQFMIMTSETTLHIFCRKSDHRAKQTL